MKLYNSISSDAVIQEMDRICGSNATSYQILAKIARANSALDRYLHLAFGADERWNFDDINESSPPIDAQNIVSGTNRYKFSDFTEKILQLMKLTVLNDDGNEVELIPETMDDLPNTFLETYKSTITGTPSHYIKYGDFIYLRPYPDYSETDGLRAYFNRPASKYEPVAVTISNASPGVLTATAHGLVADDVILLISDGTLPTGLTANTVYYVVETVATDTFSVALTKGGTAINTSDAGSGVHSFVELSKTPGIPEIHHPYLARHASLPFLIEKSLPQVNQIKKLIGSDNPQDPYYGGDELAIVKHFARRSKDTRNILTGRKRRFR